MDSIILSLICFGILIHKGDATSYHVTFLGRDHSVDLADKVGELKFKPSGEKPTITSYHTPCTSTTTTGTTVLTATMLHANCSNIIPNGTELAGKGLKVKSSDDFTLHVHQADQNGIIGDGYLAIPDEHLGDEYFVVTYCTLGGKCQFAITAVEDDTGVSVVFPNPVSQSSACVDGMPIPSSVQDGTAVPFVINEYETLHFESDMDLSGVYIKANKKVAVVVGARNVPAKAGITPETSNMIEQIIPVNKWGTEFVVVPNYLDNAGVVIKIVTKTDSTVIHIIGFTPFMIKKAGDFVERRIDWQVHSRILTSNPVMILLVMSVDLYNGTDDVSGSPSMVLVPHIAQWSSGEIYFDCKGLFSLVTSNSDNITIGTTEVTNRVDWEGVEASDYKVFVAEANTSLFEITGGAIGGYGFCYDNAAFLLAANWSIDNTECTPTTPVPGDDVDNNCNGLIDEENCTIADLVTNFTSSQDSTSGGVYYKTFVVRGSNRVKIKVSTCDIAMVTLRTTSEPIKSHTITISEKSITELSCSPECAPIDIATNTAIVGDCSGAYMYELSWGDGAPVLVYENAPSATHSTTNQVEYDEMILSAFVGSATFDVYLLEKDCGKLYLGVGEPDSFGAEFLIPVADDYDFHIVLTNMGDSPADFTVLVENNITPAQIDPKASFVITKDKITEQSYTGIKLTVEGGAEVFVYVFRKVSGFETGFSVIPTDVLGPSYHVFESNITTDTSCEVYALTANTEVVGIGTIQEDTYQTYTPGSTDSGLSYRRLLQGARPISVFCRNQQATMQMPPRETLGVKHFIPKIDLVSLSAEAQISIVAVEDSTIVVIKGDYHRLDSVTLTGEVYYRQLESFTMYDIAATKPIQVHLEIKGDNLHTVIAIPSVGQYRDDITVFGEPVGDYTDFTTLSASAISDNGTSIPVTFEVTDTPHTIDLDDKGFVVAFFKSAQKIFVLTNQQNYKDINEVCVITPSVPGDGIDNDCDGLVDEEDCTIDINPGEIDCDIDGDINEDCAAGTTAPVAADTALQVDFDAIQCATGGGNGAPTEGSDGSGSGESTGSNDSSVIVIGGTTIPLNSAGVVPPIDPSTEIVPSLTMKSGTPVLDFNMPTTTPSPGSTSAPEEICSSLCPCGWLAPQNYTAAEIQQKVMELVEKLTVSKESLSSTIRKKKSASDERPSATTVGWVAVVWLALMIGAIVALDITSVLRDLKMLGHNVRQAFQR